MCYRQIPSQHSQNAERQQAKDETERKASDRQEQRREGSERRHEPAREVEAEVE